MIEIPVADGHMLIRKGLHAFDASDVDAELRRVAASLVMCVHAALFAEVMLGDHRAPLVERQCLPAFSDLEMGRRDARHDISLATAQRAIATPDVLQAIRKLNFQFYRTAVTGRFADFAHERFP